MSPETYKILAAEFRGHMENPATFGDPHTALSAKESPWLPGGEKRSVVPIKPPGGDEDLSALNSKHWKTAQAHGRKNGGRKKR